MNRWLGPLLFLSALVASARAQGPVYPTPPRQPPTFGARNIPAPGSPANDNIANPPGSSDEVRLQFPNTDIQPILKLYEQLTGKQIIYDNSVVGTISIDISKPVSRDEAIRIIETSLYLNGFSLVPGEGNIVKVFGTGKNPRSYGVDIYSDVTQIPDGVEVATVVFQLQYADSKDIKSVLDQYIANTPNVTSTVPLPGAILVTESTLTLRNIAKIIEAADVPPAEVVSRFYPLYNANAKDVLDKLNKLFEKSTQETESPTAPAGRNPNQPPSPPGSVVIPAAASGLTEDTIIVGKIKLD